jgi:tetratricopeptide (TPR) repeat protein
MSRAALLTCLSLFLPPPQSDRPSPTATQPASPYVRQYNTIAHRILDIESQADPVSDDTYKQLDELLVALADAAQQARRLNASDADPRIAILAAIDRALTDQCYACVIPTHGLADMLRPRQLNKYVAGMPENKNRRESIESRRDRPYHYFDCDTACMVYLAVAELTGLPLAMAEAPRHTYLTFAWDDAEPILWDVNSGAVITREWIHDRYGPPPHTASNDAYGLPLSRHELIGHVYFLRGVTRELRGEFDFAIEDYRLSVALHPRSPAARNNLAWMLAARPETQRRCGANEAVTLAREAVMRYRDPQLVDTLACALAAAGRFDEAVAAQQEAIDLLKHAAPVAPGVPSSQRVAPRIDPGFVKRMQRYKQRKPWLDPPFKPAK